MSALKPWGKVFKLQHLFNDIMSVGLYCSGVGVWRVFYPLCKTAAEGLSSIFLKKETSGQGGGVPGHHGEATGWIGTLHSRGDCHMDRKKPRGKAGDLACPGAHGNWATEGQTVPAVPGSSFSLWGPQWRSSFACSSPRTSCSSTFWPADKEEAFVHWFFIVVTKCLELGRGRIYFGLWFLRLHEARFLWACGEAVSQGSGHSRTDYIMMPKNWREREGREGQGKNSSSKFYSTVIGFWQPGPLPDCLCRGKEKELPSSIFCKN